MKKNIIIIFSVTIALLLGATASYYFITVNDENETNSIATTTVESVSESYSSVSPNKKYIIYQHDGLEGKYRSLEFRNLETNEREVLSTVSLSNEFHSFIWTPDSRRVYYAMTGSDNNGNTTIFYHVPSDITVDGGAGIGFEDPDQALSGKISISGVDVENGMTEEKIYLQKDYKIYFITPKHGVGAIPVLYKDLQHSDLLISQKRITSYVKQQYETGSNGQQCWVFDLNDYIPTKNEVAKTYTWIIELPDDDCVIGKPATNLSDTLGETLNENIQGTNYRKIKVDYK